MAKRVSDTGSAKRDEAGGASVRRWSMFAVLMLCAIVTGIDQLKISAVMTETESAFGLSGTQAAFLTSVFTLAGIVLAVPGAFLQRKIGAKRLLIILMACIAAGNAGSAFSGSFGLLCVFRIAEGISYAMIIMTGLTLIGMWFGGGGAGIATGIFNTFAAVANFAAMNLLPAAARRTGVRGSWILIALAGGVCLLLSAGVIGWDDPRGHGKRQADLPGKTGDGADTPFLHIFSDVQVDLLAFAQACLGFVLFAFITCYPQLFTEYYGLNAQTANFYSSLNGLFGIPCCILCGMIAEKSRSAYIPALAGAAGSVLLCLTAPFLGDGSYIPHVLMSAVFPGGLGMTAIFCIAPAAGKKGRAPGDNVAVVNMLYYIGVFAATPAVTALAQQSWKLASAVMGCAALLGTAALAAAYRIGRKARR